MGVMRNEYKNFLKNEGKIPLEDPGIDVMGTVGKLL
jgi:hypothetical protein